MPELPEVESIVRALYPNIVDKTIKKVELFDRILLENISKFELEEVLTGQKINEVKRRGKFIVFVLSNDWRMTTHLRMTGKYLSVSKPTPSEKHTRLIITFTDKSQLHYHDLRRFGKLALYPPDSYIKALNKLGPEPLSSEFTVQYLQNRVGQRKVSIKQLLLEQDVVAGIGNIYASEILFCAKLSPFRVGSELTNADFERIVQATKKILDKAIDCLGTTFSDYRTPEGGKGTFQECLQVYGRAGQPCLTCDATVERVTQAQRSTFYCPECQCS